MMNMNWFKLQLQKGPNRNIFTNVSCICSSTKQLRKKEVFNPSPDTLEHEEKKTEMLSLLLPTADWDCIKWHISL